MDILDGGDYIIEGKMKGCIFEAYYDRDNRVMHVLDIMGLGGTNRSVTNTIEDIIGTLDKYLKLDNTVHRVFVYGTDKLVFEFYDWDKSFRILDKKDDLVFSVFVDRMMEIYSL